MSCTGRLSRLWSLSVITVAMLLISATAAVAAPVPPANTAPTTSVQPTHVPVSLLAWIAIGAIGLLVGLAATRRRRQPTMPTASIDPTDIGTVR